MADVPIGRRKFNESGEPRVALLDKGLAVETAKSFRYDIECLRGIAVLSVVLYHAVPSILPGGFVGVDIFFVISGFLITGILYRELLARGRINLAEFWARRCRRILPAATLVLLATAIAVWLTFSPVSIKSAYRDILAAACYVLNWRLVQKAFDYLGRDDQASAVLHYWSLSIEEQFYLFFPVMLSAVELARRRFFASLDAGKALFATIAVVALMSLAACISLTTSNQPQAFFNTGSRVWQLLSGGLLAIAGAAWRPATSAASNLLALAGVALVAYCLVFYSVDTHYPGLAAIIPVAGASLVIIANITFQRRSVAKKLSAPLAFAGRYSYAWYLWHWPLLVFGATALGVDAVQDSRSSVARIGLTGVALLLAVMTQLLVENPIRFSLRLVRSPRLSLRTGAALTVLGLASAGALALYERSIRIVLQGGRVVSLSSIKGDTPRLYANGCHLGIKEVESPPCRFGNLASPKTAVLFGDSHAAQWFPALEKAATAANWRLLSRTKSDCPATDLNIPNVAYNGTYRECSIWKENVLRELSAIKPDAVFVASYFNHYNSKAGEELSSAAISRRQELFSGVKRTLKRIGSVSGAVYLLADNPHYADDPVGCFFPASGQGESCHRKISQQVETSDLHQIFDGFSADRSNVFPMDLNGEICPGGFCGLTRGDTVIMRDKHHLTASFASSLAPYFEQILKSDRFRASNLEKSE